MLHLSDFWKIIITDKVINIILGILYAICIVICCFYYYKLNKLEYLYLSISEILIFLILFILLIKAVYFPKYEDTTLLGIVFVTVFVSFLAKMYMVSKIFHQ